MLSEMASGSSKAREALESNGPTVNQKPCFMFVQILLFRILSLVSSKAGVHILALFGLKLVQLCR